MLDTSALQAAPGEEQARTDAEAAAAALERARRDAAEDAQARLRR